MSAGSLLLHVVMSSVASHRCTRLSWNTCHICHCSTDLHAPGACTHSCTPVISDLRVAYNGHLYSSVLSVSLCSVQACIYVHVYAIPYGSVHKMEIQMQLKFAVVTQISTIVIR